MKTLIERFERRPYMTLFYFILMLIMMAVNVSMLFWILKMEKINCDCSNDYRRDFLKYILMISIPLSVILSIYSAFDNLKVNTIFGTTVGFVGLISFVNIFFAIYYLYQLRNSDCECSKNIRRDLFFWINLASIIGMVMTIVVLLLGVMFFLSIK